SRETISAEVLVKGMKDGSKVINVSRETQKGISRRRKATFLADEKHLLFTFYTKFCTIQEALKGSPRE
ncbi:MAG: hypothetical protein J6H18_06000, partial [Lachnospiraceae bacterium]|nr:hypothetical protein [Lachnospiraceae bacterium]